MAKSKAGGRRARRVNLAGATREFLSSRTPGDAAGVASLRDWLAHRYPGVDFGPASLRTTLSSVRADLAKTALQVAERVTREPAPGADRASITYDDLAVVKSLLDAGRMAEDLDHLRELVRHLKDAADRVGGVDRLGQAVEALCELRA